MFKQLQRSRRGLSPIFATLIVLAVVTVLFIPVFIWATGITAQNKDSWQQSGITATERIVIEQAWFNSTDNPTSPPPVSTRPIQSCTIYIRNIGDTAVTINNVIILSPNGDVHAYEKLPFPAPAPTATPFPASFPNQLTTWKPGTATSLTSIIKGDLIELKMARLNCTDTNFRIVNGTAYTVKVFTARGVSDSYQVVAIR